MEASQIEVKNIFLPFSMAVTRERTTSITNSNYIFVKIVII